jgi:hypothetical protein
MKYIVPLIIIAVIKISETLMAASFIWKNIFTTLFFSLVCRVFFGFFEKNNMLF